MERLAESVSNEDCPDICGSNSYTAASSRGERTVRFFLRYRQNTKRANFDNKFIVDNSILTLIHPLNHPLYLCMVNFEHLQRHSDSGNIAILNLVHFEFFFV